MAFRQQDKDYSCGAAALRYALTFLGRNVDEKDLRRASQTTFWGTDEGGIVKAARRHGCEAVIRNYRRFPAAFRSLTRYVQNGQPCILCVDRWMHWVAVAGANRNGVALFDPRALQVAALIKPASLRRRWAHFKGEGGEEDPHYFFIAVRQRVRQQHPRGIVDSDVVQGLRRREELRGGWDRYLQDLIALFGRRPSRAGDSQPAARFITRSAPLLVETLSAWDGEVPKKFYRTEMRNLATVARAYGMRLRPRDEKRTIVSLACILNREGLKPS
jgi:hypothetical protein